MSDKNVAAKSRKELKVPTAYPPYVNLLPPEVGQKKQAARARARAIFVAIVAIGVVVLASAGTNFYALQRTLALEIARTETQSLINQQGDYNEVRVASQMVQSTKAARLFATSTEISMNTIILAMNKKLGSGAAVVSYSFETSTPLQAYGESTSVLDPLRIEGITDASLASIELETDGTYTAAVVAFINENALLNRFDPSAAETEEVEEAEPEPEPTPAPSSTPTPTEEGTEEGSGS